MKTKNFGKKFTAFIAAVVIAVGAITTGTVLLLQQNDKSTQIPAAALTINDLLKNVADLQSNPETEHLFVSSSWVAPYEYCIEFGEYPQTHVADTDLIGELNALTADAKTGRQYLTNGNPTTASTQTWTEVLLDEYAFNDEKYVKMPAPKPFSTYTLSTGTSVSTTSTDFWFKVEPLLWFVMNYDEVDAGTATTMNLLALNEVIAGIPVHNFGKATYYDSGIRAFLNGGTSASPVFTVAANRSFLQTAFTTTSQSLINSTYIDNQTDATHHDDRDNDLADQNTTDKIYLPSYNDMTTDPFSTSQSGDNNMRVSRPTDFALVNYACFYSYGKTGGIWLRSASYSTAAWLVDLNGGIPEPEWCGAYYGVRPAMQISINNLIESNIYNDGYKDGYADGDADARIKLEPIIADKTNQINTLTGEKSALQGQITELNNTITGLNNQITALTTERNTYRDVTVPGLEADIAAKQATINQLNNVTVPGLEGQIATLTTERNTYRDVTVPGLNNQITALTNERDTYRDVTVPGLNDTITGLQQQLDNKTAELVKYISDHENDYEDGRKTGYDEGFADGKTAYPEYGYVYWNILMGSDAAGDLSEYTPYGIPVRYDYGESITPPENIQPVQSKQYTYTFLYWSTSRQTNGALPAEITFPRNQSNRDLYFYAVYERTVRTYDINFVIPVLTDIGLDYGDGNIITISGNEYGAAVKLPSGISGLLTPIYDTANHVNYIFAGWFVTTSGVETKITNLNSVMVTGERTFYARYTMQPTV